MITRRLQIGSAIAELGLILLWPLWPDAMRVGVVYFGLVLLVPITIVTSWLSRNREFPLWRSRVFAFALIGTAVLYLYAGAVWAMLVTKSVSPGTKWGRVVFLSAFALNTAVFCSGLFGKGWSRFTTAMTAFACLIVWAFPFALD